MRHRTVQWKDDYDNLFLKLDPPMQQANINQAAVKRTGPQFMIEGDNPGEWGNFR